MGGRGSQQGEKATGKILGEQPREAGTWEGQARAGARVSHRRSRVRHRLDVFLSDPERPAH